MSLTIPSLRFYWCTGPAPKAPINPPEKAAQDIHPASIIPLREMAGFADKVVRKNLKGTHPASLPTPAKPIRDGFGELVLRIKDGGTLRAVTKEEYEKLYWVFQKYAPILDGAPKPLAKSRIEMMREELRSINPNMVATFIPRTLHDLTYIRKSIEEDIERERSFPFKNPEDPTEEELRSFRESCSSNSWIADPKGIRSEPFVFPKIEISTPSDVEKNILTLMDIGYRLNKAAAAEIDRLGADIEDLTLSQIQQLVDDQIAFLERFSKDPVLSKHFSHAREDFAPLSGFFINFTAKLPKTCDEKMMGLRKITFLECQESMANKILCYRGGDLRTDSPVRKISSGVDPYSISFGSGCFSGIVNDLGACAYYHMFHLWYGKQDAYILVIDPEKESTDTFFVPSFTALESLFGDGELWHYRFKSSKDEHDDIHGITLTGKGFAPGLSDAEKLALIKGPLTIQQTVDKFTDLKKHNVILVYHLDLEI